VDLTAEVRRLVRQLDANQRAERDQAEEALLGLGVDALGLLPPITAQTPAEVKERLGRVRKALETQQVAAFSNPALITLQGERPLADVFRALQDQSGNQVVGFERRGGKIRAEFDKTSYWQALDAVLDQAELRVNELGGQEGALVVQARSEGELPRVGRAVYPGAFRIEPLRLEARRDLRNPAVNVLQLSLGIAWEPRIQPISLRQLLSEVEVRDDRGETIAVSGQQGTRNVPVEFGMSAIDFGIPLELPSREARQIATVQGRFTAMVPGRPETFEFTNLEQSRDVEQERAGIAVTFERLTKNVDLYQVRLRVRFDAADGALASHRGWIYRNPAHIIDAQGVKIDNIGLEETRREEDEAGVAYLFELPAGPKGCKFVYQTPALILQLPIEYELKDIPLP